MSAARPGRLSAAQAAAAPERLTGLAPVVSPRTRLLILGSFPSEASLRAGQYYAHPRNHFWPLLSAMLGCDFRALDYAPRLEAMKHAGIGLWDVYGACRRQGSLDSAIEAAEPNDLAALVAGLPRLRVIAHNGGESARSMRLTRALGPTVLRLPSSSPANASWSFERKRQAWQAACEAAGLLSPRTDGPMDDVARGMADARAQERAERP